MSTEPNRPDVRSANRLLLTYFAVSVGLGLLGAIAGEFGEDSLPRYISKELPYFINLIGLIVLVGYLLRKSRQYQPLSLGIRPLRWSSVFKLFIWLTIVGEGVTAFILSWFPKPLVEELLSAITPNSVNSWIALLLMAAVLAPIGEELVFRGFILNSYQRARGSLQAILLSALLFALAHHSPPHIFAAFFPGLIFARFVSTGGSLWTGILAHALVNFSSIIMMRINHLPLLFPEIEHTPAGGLCGLIIAIIATRFYFHSHSISASTTHSQQGIVSPSLVIYVLLTLTICATDLWSAFSAPTIVIPDIEISP